MTRERLESFSKEGSVLRACCFFASGVVSLLSGLESEKGLGRLDIVPVMGEMSP